MQQANENAEASKQLEELQESFRQMQVSHQRSIEEKEKQLQTVQEMHKDEPKLIEFISESIGLNDQLSQQQEEMVRKISQWREFCEISDKITSQVVELRNDYDQANKRITEYLAWQNDEEGKRAGAPKINENHKELLFNKWDEQITQATILIDCVNENLHRANLVSETTPGYLPIASQLEAEWKQKAQANGETIWALSRLNWESYWTYLVKPHSQCMTVRCIMNAVEKVAPALMDAVFTAQLSTEVGQPTLLKPMLENCNFRDQIKK